MPAITQPRTQPPYVGQRYGGFGDFDKESYPDFLHGSLVVCVTLAGEIEVEPHLDGTIEVNP